jgi:NTP pyrophosphatase (non-canonical NTP hydrolase)
MDFKEYQAKTIEFAFYPEDQAIQYLTLGLASEAGEVAGVVKKEIRDNPTITYSADFEQKMSKELGDCMWYVAQLCHWLELDFDKILEGNIDKLSLRKERGTLKGDGDDR